MGSSTYFLSTRHVGSLPGRCGTGVKRHRVKAKAAKLGEV